MVGAEFQTSDGAGRVPTPGASRCARLMAPACRAGSGRWRWIASLAALVPLSFVLAQCGKAPGAGGFGEIAQFGRMIDRGMRYLAAGTDQGFLIAGANSRASALRALTPSHTIGSKKAS